MMKFIKKTISALLASIICIPTGILNIANATEMESNGEYTVTLTDTVNGTMQFSETCMESSTATQDGYRMVQINEDGELVEIENDGSLWAFMQGDNVEIELVPDEGYKISSFTIKNASTGKVMAHKDTEDNVFSFSMPGKSVTVEAVFAQKLSVSDGEENIEETNIIAENENGDIVYQRIELVDDEAADLQERINNLPIPDDLYADFFSGEDGKIAAIEEEADQISDIYFNIFSDEQRAQIDPSLLFSTLLILRASDNVTTYDLLLDDSELAVLQDRINALNSPSEVATVAEFVEDEEFDLNYANYEYSNTDADMLITNRTQDELFLEVLDLSTTVFSLDFDQRMELDINPLDDMFRFFTMGHGESGDEADGESVAFLSKLFQTAYADAGDTEGRYNHTFYEAYKSSFFVGSTLDGDSGLTAYCGDANVSAFSHSGVPVNFSGSQELMAGDNTLNIQMARAVLYYGFDGPGQSEGIDAIVRTFPKISTIQCEGKRIQGMDVQKYMVTHFTLSYAWSGNIGNAPDTAPEYIDFYDFCYAHRFDVPSEFQCFVIVPQGRYQPIFYFKNGVGFTQRDPFNIWLYKMNSQPDYEASNALLAGAEFTITYYEAKSYSDGATDMGTFPDSAIDAISTGLSPTATFTFETKQITGTEEGSAGSYLFKQLGMQLTNMYGQLAGIECGPEDPTADYWQNDFLTSSADEYNKYFGGAGAYLIRETRSPQGYDLSGKMTIVQEDGDNFETTDLQKGVLICLAYEWVDGKLENAFYLHNPRYGIKLPSNMLTNFHFTNSLGEEEEISAELNNNSLMMIEEKPSTMRLWTSATCIDTGTQWADPNNSNIYLEDTINVQTLPSQEAKYIIDTRLYDITAGEFVSFNDGYGAKSDSDSTGITNFFNSYDVTNGIITNEFNTRTTVEPGQTYSFKVRAAIDGRNRKGHTLVFVNVCSVYDGYDGTGDLLTYYPKDIVDTDNVMTKTGKKKVLICGKIQTDEEHHHTSSCYRLARRGEKVLICTSTAIGHTHTDSCYEVLTADRNVLKCGKQEVSPHTHTEDCYEWVDSEENMTQIETMLYDTKEMIYLSESETSILSSQTQRKGAEGESIIYAGAYANNSFTNGHGVILQTLTDTVNYSNLQPNRTYTVKGYLVDKATGNVAVDANGTPIQNTQNTVEQQSSSTGSGSWDIQYSFDATGCGNKVYVSYVEVYLVDSLVLEYKNIDDMMESFYIPEITTKLWDDKTWTNLTYAEDNVTIHDTIYYKKMLPNTRYKVETTLYNMDTGEILKDVNGAEIRREQIVNIGRIEDGQFAVDVTFPAVIRDAEGNIAKSLAGTVFVAFEKIYIEQGSEGSENWVLVADHEDFYDENQRIYMPYIDTTALDQKTAHHISYAEKTMKLYDTVHYEALHPEYTYKLVSELRDVATGEIVTDDAGVRQVVTSYFKADFDMLDNQFLTYGDVIPENHENSGITFDVDAEYFAGRTLVVYERLYFENEYSEEYLIAEHQELLDEDQTIHVPKIWTSAIDSDTFTKTSFADNSTTIIDTISYENLIPGLTYEMKGYIIDKNQSIQTGTNIVATGTNGKLAENTLTFTPERSSGAVKLSFEIDTSKFGTADYNGMVFVVYEELYVIDRYDDADHRCIVATHTDIADVNQTVYVPRITTSLNDKKSGSKILLAEQNARLTDTVNYYRFQPSTDYTIKGKLIDMETGDVLIDSKGNRVEKTVTVTSSATGTGEWAVNYEFDATELQGKVIVAYADVYVRNGERNDILSPVATHTDFWDEEQRVYIPVISTVATDQKTNSHITYAEDNVWITDRIYYSYLKPGTEYKLISKLIDKETGEVVVDDNGIVQQIESAFTTTPNESQERYNQIISNPFTDSSDTGIGYSYGYVIPADGTTLPDGTNYRGVVFTLDAHTFEGRTLVIYEELQIKSGNEYYTIASHMDINDENQTVHIPKIRTNAVDSETLTHTSKMDGQMTIIDTVSYENLIPGFTYVLEGYLMDKPRDDTKGYGKIKDKDGNYITNTIEFTPDKPNGSVKLSLSGNASEFQTDEGAFSSETLVVFERLYLKDNKDATVFMDSH